MERFGRRLAEKSERGDGEDDDDAEAGDEGHDRGLRGTDALHRTPEHGRPHSLGVTVPATRASSESVFRRDP